MIELRVEMDGGEIERLLARVSAEELRSEVSNAIAHHFEGMAADSFEGQKSPEGADWTPLSAATIARRGAGAKILDDTGAMINSMIVVEEKGGFVLKFTATAKGKNGRVSYPAVHQFGTGGAGGGNPRVRRSGSLASASDRNRAGRGHAVAIPARPFLPIDENGLIVSGEAKGLIEAIELKDHPWFVAVQFHPEFTSRLQSPNRVIFFIYRKRDQTPKQRLIISRRSFAFGAIFRPFSAC